MLRIGIIGCGKIADQHAEAIRYLPGCEITGVCDEEELMARQMYERFSVGRYFGEVSSLLEEAKPEVVHITTPPQSHFTLAKRCLEAGCHVYVEKPFTLNIGEARELIALADGKGLKITAGHNVQFTQASRRMRDLIRGGYLGGDPIHLESYYCYEMGDPSYAKALLGDKGHWVRRLPGQLLQNYITHGISKIAEFLRGGELDIAARGFTSPLLKSIGEDLQDELRVSIQDERGTSAFFMSSSQIRPSLHQLRVYGPKNGMIADDDQQTVIRLEGRKYKSYVHHFVPPLVYAGQYLGNLKENAGKFLKRDFVNDSGMRFLIGAFYGAIMGKNPLPLSYREILMTVRIMDEIFTQLNRVEKKTREEGS